MSAVIKTSCSWAAIVTFNTLSFFLLALILCTSSHVSSEIFLGQCSKTFLGMILGVISTYSSNFFYYIPTSLLFFIEAFFQIYFPCRPNLNGNRLHRTDGGITAASTHEKDISPRTYKSVWIWKWRRNFTLSNNENIYKNWICYSQPASQLLRPNLKLSFTFDVCCFLLCVFWRSLWRCTMSGFFFREWQREKHQNNGISISLFSSLYICLNTFLLLLQLQDQTISCCTFRIISNIFHNTIFFWFEF